MKKFCFVLVMLTTLFLAVGSASSCDYQIALFDSFGDGWNGGKVTVYVNGVPVLSDITLSSGAGPEYHTFSVDTGDVISTSYVAGSFSYENSYIIIDYNRTAVASDGDGGATPTGLADIIAYCSMPIPTLSEWGMIIFIGLLLLSSVAVIKRQRG